MYNKKKLISIILTGISGRNYVPARDIDFLLWAQKLYEYANANHVQMGIVEVDADILTRLGNFAVLATKCESADHTKADEVEKREVRKVVEKDARNFVQGALSRNIKVNSRDREIMKIPIHDTTPTPVPDPTGQATAEISYPGRAQLKLHISHIEGTPLDKKASYGFRIYHKLCAAGDTPPLTGMDLTESSFSRRKAELFTFPPTESGKTAYFSLRYENSKGKAGPWGPMFSAIIP
jgi:hypothetical protein